MQRRGVFSALAQSFRYCPYSVMAPLAHRRTTRFYSGRQKTFYSERKSHVFNGYVRWLESSFDEKIEKLIAVIEFMCFGTCKRPFGHGFARRDVDDRTTARPQHAINFRHIPAIGIEKIDHVDQQHLVEH